MNGYGCNFCDEPRPVVWLITSLANGETLACCAEDFPVALIPLLAGELGVDPDKFYDVVKRFVDREAAKAAKTKKPVDDVYAPARAQYGDTCPECGVAWEKPSPDCPREVWDLHPVPEQVPS